MSATVAIAAAFLLAGALVPLRWSAKRFAPFALRVTGCVTFLVLGPLAAWLALGAGAIAGAIFASSSRWLGRAEAAARAKSSLASGVATALGALAAHVVVRAIDRGYPLAVAPLSSMVAQVLFWLPVNVYLIVSLVVDELLLRFVIRPAPDDPRLEQIEPRLPSFVIAGITSAPLTFAAQVVYDPHALLPWCVALGWIFLLTVAFARQVARRRRIGELMDELATKERLAAVGEVSARVVHQTRHQLGLIGITVHRIAKRLSALPSDDAKVVREELEKLGDVQRELSEMLTGVLRPGRGDAPQRASSYADLVAAVARRLDALAVSRGVRLALGDLAAARRASPAHPDNVSDAVFNVLENALVAAKREVAVAADARGETLVVSVSDDGPGMPEEVIARAKAPFVTTKADGTGMGLVLARAAVEGEKGTLRIKNRDGAGCVVEIAVPLRAAST